MGWFHSHKWKLVGKTYAPPSRQELEITGHPGLNEQRMLDRAMHGCTTYLWECTDESCDAIRKEECLGKEVE